MIFLLVYSIFHVLEAWVEEIVIAQKNYSDLNYKRLNREEHKRSAWMAFTWFVCVVLACTCLGYYWLLPALPFNRRIFFDYGLILFRDRPKSLYEGDDWWVARFRRVFGNEGRLKELAIELLITIFCAAAHCLTEKNIWL